MARVFAFRESLKRFYEKNEQIVLPLWKLMVSFFMLFLLQRMFPYDGRMNNPLIFLAISLVQAFLPLGFLFFTGSALIASNLWNVSIDVLAVFAMLFVICLLVFVRIEMKYCFLIIVTAVLFYLKLEYLVPVMVGITIGSNGICPVGAGVLLYFFSTYTSEIFVLVSSNTDTDAGMGMQRMAEMLFKDRYLFVILASFILVVIISAALYNIVHEKSGIFAILFGNILLALFVLAGRMVFDLDYSIIRVIAVAILSMALGALAELFGDMGDISRIERVSFEDDEYIYYVKAVPKIKISQKEKNVTAIEADEILEEEQ